MPMRSGLKRLLEYALKKAAKEGPRPWPQLKAELVSDGLSQDILEEYHTFVSDLFLEYLTDYQQETSSYDSGPSRSRSPPSPRPPSPTASSDMTSAQSSRSRSFKAQSRVAHTRKPEEGWIGLTEGTPEKARVSFSFGSKRENIIGAHIIDRYKRQLEPRVRDDSIELVWGLDSQPARTHFVNYRVEESETFDVLLGRYWDKQNQANSSSNSNSSTVRTKKESHGRKDVIISQSPLPKVGIDDSNAAPSQYSPEYVARLLKELSIPPGNPQPSAALRSPRRQKDKQPGFYTDPEPKARTRRPPRTGIRVFPSNHLTDERFGPRADGRNPSPLLKGVARRSDASMTSDMSSVVFDTDQYQGDESDGTDISIPDIGPVDQKISPPVRSVPADIIIQDIRPVEQISPPVRSLSPSVLLEIDNCWKVDSAPQRSEYGPPFC